MKFKVGQVILSFTGNLYEIVEILSAKTEYYKIAHRGGKGIEFEISTIMPFAASMTKGSDKISWVNKDIIEKNCSALTQVGEELFHGEKRKTFSDRTK